MNERIRELYKQAGLTMNNPLAYEQWYLDSLEKFAELIVRDIYQYVDGLDTAQIISNGILKRYGVTV